MFRRHFRAMYRLQSRRLRRFVMHSVLHADDPPHRLALGAAIGIFVTFTPTVGIQMLVAIFLAWLLRANKAIGVPLVWISNPATFVPMYYPCYVVGRLILRRPPIEPGWWKELADPPGGWSTAISFYWTKFLEIALPLWVGCLVVGLTLGYLTYHFTYRAICAYRMRRWGQLMPPSAKTPKAGPR
ncbi:MAG: DUF2062 domain-containing protein [Planctomycetes bacterium]|nr:DUF2062 domain-containing protein [Planctomycetota bacterium]